jgi:hypothetical protein
MALLKMTVLLKTILGKGNFHRQCCSPRHCKTCDSNFGHFKIVLQYGPNKRGCQKNQQNTEQFLCWHKLCVRSPARTRKPVTGRNLCCNVSFLMLMGIIQKPTLRSYFTAKRVLSTLRFAKKLGSMSSLMPSWGTYSPSLRK